MFCIGTEFSRLSVEKPVFWKNLIREVRKIYSGKITYAANWYEEYEGIEFWEDLDFIGIQAYFPLVNKEYPSVEEISKGWNKYLPSVKSVSKKYKRRVLFTELGYKSTSDSAVRPWEWVDEQEIRRKKTFSGETQSNCYLAFFDRVWSEDWFAGVHIWQMRSDFKERKGPKQNLDFEPQGKPALPAPLREQAMPLGPAPPRGAARTALLRGAMPKPARGISLLIRRGRGSVCGIVPRGWTF